MVYSVLVELKNGSRKKVSISIDKNMSISEIITKIELDWELESITKIINMELWE